MENNLLSTENRQTEGPFLKSEREEEEISLLDLLILLAEHKRMIFSITAGCTVLALIISFLLPTEYTAKVAIMPPQQSSSLASALTSQLGGIAQLAGSSLGLKNPNDMYIAMFKTNTVEIAMVQKYNLMQEYRGKTLSDACKKFEDHAKLDGSGKDGLIRISVTDKDPRRASELANGYVEQFHALSQHLAITEAGQRRIFFEQQLEQAKNNLADAEVALQQTEQKTGVLETDSQSRGLLQMTMSLRAKIEAQEIEIQGMQTYATNENSKLQEAQQELARMRSELAKLGGSEAPDNESSFTKGQVANGGMEYTRKLRDVKYYQTIFELLAKQYEIAKLDEAKEGAVIQVIDPATPPEKRSSPKRGIIVIVSTIVGFFLGIFIILAVAALQHGKEDPEASLKLSRLRTAFSTKQSTSL
ncbi:GumC family protein (plasmid) [Telmatobacter bradus]|uniref:GumC family protein n=1 Tax=Telmatobacter bradus TaxID=474953 RepID=UPI003B43B49C